MKKFIVAGNWKMNHGLEEAQNFMQEFCEKKDEHSEVDFILFPSFLSWKEVCSPLKNSKNAFWGLQNVHSEESGAFTGEVSVNMAKESGAQYALVGHSERRQIFQEKNDFLSLKVKALQSNGLVPVYCVGETLEERESGKMQSVLSEQIKEGLALADFAKPLVIAYEPVWAIGTGKVATPEQAQEAHEFLKEQLRTLVSSDEVLEKLSVLYGGSVKPGNAKELSEKPDVDGFLVGGASLKAESFLQIAANIA